MALNEKSGDLQSYLSWGVGKNVWPKFHDNQSTSRLDISVWNEVLDWVTDIAIPRATLKR